MLPVSASLVVYRTPAVALDQLLRRLQSVARAWVVVDNSAEEVGEAGARRQAVEAHGGTYLPASGNLGFGAGHNLAMRWLREAGSETTYHLMVNPDVAFESHVVQELTRVLEERPEVGWAMPQVRSEEGVVQPLCKLLPSPMDLFGRRFLPKFVGDAIGISRSRYEMDGVYDRPFEGVPFLSGCFIFARRSMLEQTAGFDPKYFLYMEDVDLGRRFREFGKLLYWPRVHVVHGHHRGSYHDLRLTLLHVRSAIRYFRQWGWFRDPEREAINETALRQLREMVQGQRVAEHGDVEPHSSAPVTR